MTFTDELDGTRNGHDSNPVPPAPSPPFVPADAAKLGFPVYSKPIAALKTSLGPFPKVPFTFTSLRLADMNRLPHTLHRTTEATPAKSSAKKR